MEETEDIPLDSSTVSISESPSYNHHKSSTTLPVYGSQGYITSSSGKLNLTPQLYGNPGYTIPSGGKPSSTLPVYGSQSYTASSSGKLNATPQVYGSQQYISQSSQFTSPHGQSTVQKTPAPPCGQQSVITPTSGQVCISHHFIFRFRFRLICNIPKSCAIMIYLWYSGVFNTVVIGVFGQLSVTDPGFTIGGADPPTTNLSTTNVCKNEEIGDPLGEDRQCTI